MKKKTLSKSDKKELNLSLEKYGYSFDKKDLVEILEHKYKVIKVNHEMLFFYYEDKIYPSMKLVLKQDLGLKKIVLDMGAIKFIAGGADVMRPGIVSIDDGILEGDCIVMVDETHGKQFALGIAMMNSSDMQNASSGKVIKNIHFVGDDIWNI